MKSRHTIWVPILVVFLGLGGCTQKATQPVTVVEGNWGGDHIALSIENDAAVLEYDCAHGTMDEALILNPHGYFELLGTHTRETGVPSRVGEEPDTHPARYHGRVLGDTLTLTITLVDSGEMIGPYTLVRDEPGLVHKCL